MGNPKMGTEKIGSARAFSHGTGDFRFMHAFGEAWVEMGPLGYRALLVVHESI